MLPEVLYDHEYPLYLGSVTKLLKVDTLLTTFPPCWEYWLWNGKVYVRNVDTNLNWSNVGVREECEVGVIWISSSSNPWEGAVEQISFLYQVSFIERIWELKLIHYGSTDTMWVKGLKDWRRHSKSHKWGPDVFMIFKKHSVSSISTYLSDTVNYSVEINETLLRRQFLFHGFSSPYQEIQGVGWRENNKNTLIH